MKSVLVTGASTGIGESTAKLLAHRGFFVWAGVRKPTDGTRLEGLHANIRSLVLDVTDLQSILSAVEVVSNSEHPFSGLVNNAGVAVAGPLEFLDLQDLRDQFEVNFFGVHSVTRAFLPLLRKNQGRVVQISSVSGRVAFPFVGPYAASKFALEGYSDSLRRELRPFGIRVSLIEPGRIKTPIWEKSRAANQPRRHRLPRAAETFYGTKMDKMDELTHEAQRISPGPEIVAKKVYRALSSRCPKARYLIGLDARIEVFLSLFLPTSWIDFLFGKLL